MLHRFLTYLLLTLCVLGVAGLTACSKDEAEAPIEPEIQKNGTFFSLALHPYGAHTSRGPQGGEDGDGRLAATQEEYKVNNATILFYRATDGINAPAKTTIDYALYAPVMTWDEAKRAYKTEVLHSPTPFRQGTYHYIVLTNMGDQTALKDKTLGEIRDLNIAQTYMQRDANDPLTASDFIMSNEKDVTATFVGEGGPKNIVETEATVERLAARIDFSPGVSPEMGTAYTGGTEKVNFDILMKTTGEKRHIDRAYEFKVVNSASTDNVSTGDVFLMTSVTPVNLWIGGTQLIKRVCDLKWTDYTHLRYLGDELTDNVLGEATTYVVSSSIFEKDADNFASFADSYAKPYTSISALPATNPSLKPVAAKSQLTLEDQNDSNLKYYVLSYAQENTITPAASRTDFVTGIVMHGYYGRPSETDSKVMEYNEKTYSHFIRHTDPNNTNSEALEMKYGIVRNNVYRVYINRVTNLGLVLVVVKDWITIKVPEIQI